MESITKIHVLIIGGVIVLLGLLIPGVKDTLVGGPATPNVTASTTVYSVTTSASVRAVATSSRRVAFEVTPFNCATGAYVAVRHNLDSAATVSNGSIVFASTTERYGDNSEVPTSQFSVQMITGVGTCSVAVTEWRE